MTSRGVRKLAQIFPRDCIRQQQSFTNGMNMATTGKKATAKVYLQVLGTATEDTTASLFLFADSQRYLFNCGEGTQRLVNEHKLKLSKMSHIFFTQLKWEYVGGLPGMAMTLRDGGKSNLALYGPSNMQQFIDATRFFLYKEKLQFECVGFAGDDGEKYSDENLTIWPVVLQGDPEKTDQTLSDEHPHKKRRSDPLLSSVVCYVCQLASLPGKFLPKKAAELGVPKGPLFGALHRGETVTLADGTQVRPDEVNEASKPGPVMLIIDCPSLEFVPKLVNNEKFTKYQADKSPVPLLIMVHLCPINVFQQPEYQAWMKSFGDSVKHLLINKAVCSRPFVFRSQTQIQSRLHSIEPSIFPLLHTTEGAVVGHESLPRNCVAADNFLIFHLRPSKMQGFDTSDIPERLVISDITDEAKKLIQGTSHGGFTCESSIKSSRQVDLQTDERDNSLEHSQPSETHIDKKYPDNKTLTPKVKETQQDSSQGTSVLGKFNSLVTGSELMTPYQGNINAHRAADSESKHLDNARDSSEFTDFEVVFIGTGAALPSKYRNVSATLLNVSDKTSVLLDCGEGTYGQLYRHYGEALDNVIRNLSCVFISHIHADHHLGLIQVLLQSQKQKQESLAMPMPILVIGPAKIGQWLHEYDCLCEDIQYRFIDSSTLVHGSDSGFQDLYQQLELRQVLAVPVHHCFQAYGLVLQHSSGWKLVYSGDTRPCEELVTAGASATLLIHEATFEDELSSEALEKMHSTTTEAINSGLGMNAQLIMLNHFSQRYPKIPVFSEKFTKHTGIAFDHMRVRLSDFHKIPGLLQPLQVLFAQELTSMSKED